MEKEEIILKVLNEDTSAWVRLMEHDRKRIAKTLAKILDTIEGTAKEQKRKEASEEISARLETLAEIEALYDELKKLPFYKFSERNVLKCKIKELDAKRLYGGYFKKDAHDSIASV